MISSRYRFYIFLYERIFTSSHLSSMTLRHCL
nr:MAG TPA: hypothetical protein [Caudoviricetes sp.]